MTGTRGTKAPLKRRSPEGFSSHCRMSINQPAQNELCDARELAGITHLHEKTILRLARIGAIPCIKLSARIVRFFIPDVMESLKREYQLKAKPARK